MSNTSLLICASQFCASQCRPGLSEHAANSLNCQLAGQVLQRSGWRGRLLLTVMRWPVFRALFSGLLQSSLPGIVAHYQWRKQHIASRVRQQVTEQGVQQLLIIGAGFDALGARLSAEFQQLQVIEIDRAETINIKQQALQRLNAQQPNLWLKAADLASCSMARLLADTKAFSATRSTLVLAEGVLMYLPQPAINALLQQLRHSINAPLQLVASQMQLNQQGRARFTRQRWPADVLLAISGERFVSGVSAKALPDWLTSMGFNLQQLVPADQPGNSDPCPGELLFYAEARPEI
ncbi:class I SAM-dependent methyltransferase [Arsukibacterium sp.]|uniref:class I SAM-dependent methyltransferase n=1 Tax=Arsukibacterium sp. TaxID=1977258 RepID=UPI001BD2C983|nr:class I SAM-dependent methyltransferase [Arsukibacterium sp.]